MFRFDSSYICPPFSKARALFLFRILAVLVCIGFAAPASAVDCNSNMIDDSLELNDETDCDSSGVLDECEITNITDCDDNGILDVCEIEPSLDCNDNGVLDSCEPDCNTNGVPDDCDISDTTSEDCNTNGVPDDCEIAAGSAMDCNSNGVPDTCDTDCNTNGIPDECDLTDMTSDDCDSNGVPDECDPDCNSNTLPDACDIVNGFSLDCNLNGIADECELASNDCNNNSVPDDCEADCNSNDVPDDCDISSMTSDDCNSNNIPDDCDPDCDTDGTPDDCEITNMTQEDCNNNDAPDDCEIADETAEDCNSNDIPDDCDIADETVPDVNSNGIPDSCEPATIDCNDNDVADDIDILSGDSNDLNTNGIPDECEDCNDNGLPDDLDLLRCEQVDIVLLLDTSASMDDEMPGLCVTFGQVEALVEAAGITANFTGLGIADAPGGDYFCVTTSVPALLGSTVPNESEAIDDNEDWGLAIKLVSTNFPWTPGASRVILVASDEDPLNGNGCFQSDEDLIDRAILTAIENEVSVIPVLGSAAGVIDGQDISCLPSIMSRLATQTGGEDFTSSATPNDIAFAINAVITENCFFTDCNDNGVPDDCETEKGGDIVTELPLNPSNTCADAEPICVGTISGVTTTALSTDGTVDCAFAGAGTGFDLWYTYTPGEGGPITIDTRGSSFDTVLSVHLGCPGSPANQIACNDDICFNNVPPNCSPSNLDSEVNFTGVAGTTYFIRVAGFAGDSGSFQLTISQDTMFPCIGPTAGGTTDCNENGILDECEIDAGLTEDCNGNAIPDDCEVDCNENGIPDDCETMSGATEDCNNNTIPDSCEILDGSLDDCDNNGIPDICDFGCNLDIVVIIENSASIGAVAEAAGDVADMVVDQLAGIGSSEVLGTILSVSSTFGFSFGEEVDGTVEEFFGTSVPGGGTLGSEFDVADAVAIVAENFEWRAGFNRVIITMADAPPEGGLPCNEEDGDAIDNAISVASDNNVMVMPYIPRVEDPVTDLCTLSLSNALAAGTGGSVVVAQPALDTFSDLPVHPGVQQSTDAFVNFILNTFCSGDCNGNNVLDSCEIAASADADANGNGILDECDPDCNGNGILDSTDIANMTSEDCNANGIPDECDIGLGQSLDCQSNGIPDECEADCDNNGAPDECEILVGQGFDFNDNDILDRCEALSADFVIIMDTSGSLRDEAEAICDDLDGIVASLQSAGIAVRATVMGITQNPSGSPDNPFPCIDWDVLSVFGNEIPDSGLLPAECVSRVLDDNEDWGPAVAIVANKFPWAAGFSRTIFVVLDEDPDGGDGCDECDAPHIANAVFQAFSNSPNVVAVNTIVAEAPTVSGRSFSCVPTLAEQLSVSTGGEVMPTVGVPVTLTARIAEVLERQTRNVGDCDGNGVRDLLDIYEGRLADCNDNQVADICEIEREPNRDADFNGVPDDCECTPLSLGPLANSILPLGVGYISPPPVLLNGQTVATRWNLIDGPAGTKINENTGRVSWNGFSAEGSLPSPVSMTIRGSNRCTTEDITWFVLPEIEGLDCGSELIESVDFKAVGTQGGAWTSKRFLGSGSFTPGPLSGNGLCMTVPAAGQNDLGWKGPEQWVDLKDNTAYRVRLTMSTTQSDPSKIPMWTLNYDNRSESGQLNYGGFSWFLSIDGGANGIGTPEGRTTFDTWVMPNSVATPQWRGTADDGTTGAFEPEADPRNDMRFSIRILDYDSNGIGSESDEGTICVEKIVVESILLDCIADAGTPYEAPITSSNYRFVSVSGKNTAAKFDNAARLADITLGTPDGRVSLRPGGDASAQSRHPAIWEDNTLYRVSMWIQTPEDASGSDPIDMIQVIADTRNSELGSVHWSLRGNPGGPENMFRSASPRKASVVGGAQEYQALFYGSNVTASPLASSARFRPTGDFFNTQALFGGSTGTDPIEVTGIKITRILAPGM